MVFKNFPRTLEAARNSYKNKNNKQFDQVLSDLDSNPSCAAKNSDLQQII